MRADTTRRPNVVALATWRSPRARLDPFGSAAGCCVCGRRVCEGDCPQDIRKRAQER